MLWSLCSGDYRGADKGWKQFFIESDLQTQVFLTHKFLPGHSSPRCRKLSQGELNPSGRMVLNIYSKSCVLAAVTGVVQFFSSTNPAQKNTCETSTGHAQQQRCVTRAQTSALQITPLPALLAGTRTPSHSSLLHEGLQLLLQGCHLRRESEALQYGMAGTPGSSSPSTSVSVRLPPTLVLLCLYIAGSHPWASLGQNRNAGVGTSRLGTWLKLSRAAQAGNVPRPYSHCPSCTWVSVSGFTPGSNPDSLGLFVQGFGSLLLQKEGCNQPHLLHLLLLGSSCNYR